MTDFIESTPNNDPNYVQEQIERIRTCPLQDCGDKKRQILESKPQAPGSMFSVSIFCPCCRITSYEKHDETSLDAFAQYQKSEEQKLRRLYEILFRVNRETEIDIFVRALELDLITADDFRIRD